MSILWGFVEQLPFLTLVWMYYAMIVIHELEEWNIDRFERRHFVGLPSEATDRSARMVIAFVSAVGLAWWSVATLAGNSSLAAWIFLPAVAFMMLNALQHIFWSFYFKKLAPGAVSAALLIIPFGSFIAASAINRGYVPGWYAANLGVAALTAFINTAVSGKHMPALIQSGNRIGIWLAERIR